MTTANQPRLEYRPALDGLRGIAVVAVVLYHLDMPWLPGGFLGVDIFFVLSGYLITSLLLREWSQTDGVDLKRFWTRRARRLLPALIVVVAVTSIVVREVGGLPTGPDAIATLFYFANWRYIATSQSYFADLTEASPFRHTWSLAIEEHFYLLWPLVFIALARLSPNRPSKRLAPFLVVLICASAGMMFFLHSTANPSRAYYGTDTRIGQIAVGVLTAVLMTNVRHSGRLIRSAPVATASLGMLFLAMATVGDESVFYYRGGAILVAVAAAVLIVASETREPGPSGVLLENSPIRWIGKLSYGIYLWHWPIIVYLIGAGFSGAQLSLLAVVATAGVSLTSFFFLEQPIRRGHLGSLHLTPRKTAVLSASGVLAVFGVVALVSNTVDVPEWMVAAEEGPEATVGTVEPQAGSFAMALIGDSVAASLSPGLRSAAADLGIGYASAAQRGCALADGKQVDAEGSPYTYTERCDELIPTGISDMLEEVKPDLVLWYSGREAQVHFLVDGVVLVPGTPAHTEYIRAELANIRDLVVGTGAELRIVYPFPMAHEGCATEPDRDQCEGYRTRAEANDRLAKLLDEIADQDSSVETLDLTDIVCRGSVGCDPRFDGERLREDGSHFTEEMAARVGPEILQSTLASLPNLPRLTTGG